MNSNCRISTRRNVRQSAPCQEINNIFNTFKHDLQNAVQGDCSFIKKLPATHKITCQMIQRMPQLGLPSKQNEFTSLQYMKKMMHLQQNLLKNDLFNQEQFRQTQELSEFQEMQVQKQVQFQKMKNKLMEQDIYAKQKMQSNTKQIVEIQLSEDLMLMDDKIRIQLDKYLTMN